MTEEKVVNPTSGQVFDLLCSVCGLPPEKHSNEMACKGGDFTPYSRDDVITDPEALRRGPSVYFTQDKKGE